ncbi:MAG: hypothetical protein QOE96_997 [Blastocatellia bacterium]|nr:hypothetical protein [Blastocatellia bacterium]
MLCNVGVPYGSRTRVAAVKEKRPIVIQRNLAAWIALYRSSRTHGNRYWTLNGRALAMQGSAICYANFRNRTQVQIKTSQLDRSIAKLRQPSRHGYLSERKLPERAAVIPNRSIPLR